MKKLLTIVILLLTCGVLYASNYRFLDYAAISYFTEEDANLMTVNANKALNSYPDGKKSMWKNPQTGAWGYALPLQTSFQKGHRCRSLFIYNNARGAPGKAEYRLCRINHEWQYVN